MQPFQPDPQTFDAVSNRPLWGKKRKRKQRGAITSSSTKPQSLLGVISNEPVPGRPLFQSLRCLEDVYAQSHRTDCIHSLLQLNDNSALMSPVLINFTCKMRKKIHLKLLLGETSFIIHCNKRNMIKNILNWVTQGSTLPHDFIHTYVHRAKNTQSRNKFQMPLQQHF